MPPTGTQETATRKRQPLPRLLLLSLLIPGSRVLSETPHLLRTVGQTLSMRCQYQPAGRSYQRKGWCKELSAITCLQLVTSSEPLRLTQVSRFSIWDHPGAGFFHVSMTGLKEEDSGYYWCRVYSPSGRSVSQSLRFYLAVSPAAPSSTLTNWTPADLVPSQAQSHVDPTTRATETSQSSSAITAPSQYSRQQNCTLCPSPKATRALVPVFTGLFMGKSLVFAALLVTVLKKRQARQSRRSLMHLRHLDPEGLSTPRRARAVAPQKTAHTISGSPFLTAVSGKERAKISHKEFPWLHPLLQI